jgi:acetyl esterase
MRHSPRALYPRSALLTFLADALTPQVALGSLEEIQAARRSFPTERPPFSWVVGSADRSVGITYGTAQARDGWEIPLRLYRSRAARDTDTDVPVIVFAHGGGFIQGNVVMYDPLCSGLAASVHAVVVSVDYRLAPEHRAPTAAHDVVDAARWVVGRPEVLRADTSRLALVGDSSGGNLAAVTAQQLRDEGMPVRHQALIYPATDMTMSSLSIQEHAHAPVLTEEVMVACRQHYAPPPQDWTDPAVSPLFGRLEGLAPALVQTADVDPLRDDGVRYAEALRHAGVSVRHTNYVRVPHGFAFAPTLSPSGPQQRAELVAELRSHLYAVGAPPRGPAS